jgi:hypothetical protein
MLEYEEEERRGEVVGREEFNLVLNLDVYQIESNYMY